MVQYRQRLDEQQRRLQQQTAALQQQRRMAQYRFQEEYLERLRDQDRRLREERHDYNNDPYFYTAPIYRYNRGGAYYETNQYGADLLRQAVNSGYEEGFRAGAADREDNWRPDYRNSYAYQDANYGYNGYYVDPKTTDTISAKVSSVDMKMATTTDINMDTTRTARMAFWEMSCR